jgi:hypothetical protein
MLAVIKLSNCSKSVIHLHKDSVKWGLLSHRGKWKLRNKSKIMWLLHNQAKIFIQAVWFKGRKSMIFPNFPPLLILPEDEVMD